MEKVVKESEYFKRLSISFSYDGNTLLGTGGTIRKIINPFELDIFIPKLNLAIEYNGVYWHSEKLLNNDYHKNKYDLCKSKNNASVKP